METEKIIETIESVSHKQSINKNQLELLLSTKDASAMAYLYQKARAVCDGVYGTNIYIRGLIEFTNICKNDCYYCGIRKSNATCDRYRLSEEEILECCETGYKLGFRTFVLQGGEDGYFDDDRMCHIVSAIREKYPDCAITLSLGERSRESYRRLFEAGANRYLLRHETANEEHYGRLHPADMSLKNRIRCLYNLKEIGYQVGCGFMVGAPYQSIDTLYEDIMFIKELKPHMVGIGPFIAQHATPFADKESGKLQEVLKLLSIIRLVHPMVLLPATTALGTIHPNGREFGILAGANVIMPNLSPSEVRKKYELYDNKLSAGEEAAENIKALRQKITGIGYNIVEDIGNSLISC